MIQAKDLRIGNLVNWKGTPCTIDGIQCMIDADVEPARTGYTVDLLRNGEAIQTPWVEDIEPIAITPEWLERLGFKLWEETQQEVYANRIHLIKENDQLFLYNWVEDDTYYSWQGIEVTTAHQLQNLYHALTGEELTINDV